MCDDLAHFFFCLAVHVRHRTPKVKKRMSVYLNHRAVKRQCVATYCLEKIHTV